MMPVSQSAQDIANMPAAVAIKTALDNIENAKTKRDEALKECVEKLSNLNLIEELMTVHQGNGSKDAVFTAKREEYNEYFKRM